MCKKLFLALAGLALTCMFSSTFAADKPIEVKLAVATGKGHVYNVASEYFQQRVQELTGGRVIVHFYPGGQLSGDQRILAEGVQMGSIDLTVPSVAVLSGFSKDLLVVGFPYLWSSPDHCYQIMDGPIGQELNKGLAPFNMTVLGWWPTGLYVITNSKRPINSVEDVKGLKIRTMENPLTLDVHRTWGTIPTPMALGEVFTALQQGTIDGQENSDANTFANKYYEVQKYMALTQHFFFPSPFLMSTSRLNAMPEDLRKLFLQAGTEASKLAREEYARQSAAAVENMKKAGVEVSYPDKSVFQKLAQSVYPKYLKDDPKMAQRIKEIQESAPK
jgi:tripartite ATP-independent transporter DctP family solute receptor